MCGKTGNEKNLKYLTAEQSVYSHTKSRLSELVDTRSTSFAYKINVSD